MSLPPELDREIERALRLIERMVKLVPMLTERQAMSLLLKIVSMQALVICIKTMPTSTDFHEVSGVMARLLLDVADTERLLATLQ